MLLGAFFDKLGITFDEVHAGANATMWSSLQDFTPGQKARFEAELDRVYDDFTSKAAEGRKLSKEKVLEIAQGRVWTGEDALGLGLVDALGGYGEALRMVRETLGLKPDAPLRLQSFPPSRGFLTGLIERFVSPPTTIPTTRMVQPRPCARRWRPCTRSRVHSAPSACWPTRDRCWFRERRDARPALEACVETRDRRRPMTKLVRLRVPDRRAHARQHQRAEILGAARRCSPRWVRRGHPARHHQAHEPPCRDRARAVPRQGVDPAHPGRGHLAAAAHPGACGARPGDVAGGFVGDAYRAFFTFLAEDRVTFDLLRREPATIRALLQEPTLMASVMELREDLEAAVARGHLPHVDLDYLAAAMAGVAVEVALRMVERHPLDVQGATAFVTQLFLGGLARLQAAPRSRRAARSGRRSR